VNVSRVVRRALAAAVLVTFGATSVASAHSPTPGAAKGSLTANQVITYKFGGSYPSWLTAAVNDSLQNKYDDPNAHNSRAPTLQYSSTGTAIVYYSNSATSPCSGRTDWLQCASNGGTASWRIYVRNFDAAPLGSAVWWDKAGSCNGSSSCWYIRRAMIHETGHAVLTFPDLTGWSESDTVMNGKSPTVTQTGGDHFVYQRCDEAASQLVWDVRNYAGPYGDCFDHITGHGTYGLITTMTTSGTSFNQCIGLGLNVSGRLAIKATSDYGVLSNNPLAGRTVWVDRKLSTSTTWTLKVASTTANATTSGNNWTRSFGSPTSTGGTYNYRAHFDRSSASGLDSSNKASFTILWSRAC
jgi:hypothetical protein